MTKYLTTIFLLSFAAILTAGDMDCRIELDRAELPAGKDTRAVIKVTLDAPGAPVHLDRPAVNVALVIDRSSSMTGTKLEKAKEGAIQALRRLSSGDIISVITYSDQIQTLIPAQRISGIRNLEETIRGITASGSTALFGGVSQGAAEVRKHIDGGYIHRVILLSDGLANVGPQSPEDLGRLGAALIKEGMSVSTVGLGDDYNEDLMTRLSQQSDGNTYYVEASQDLPSVFSRELGSVLNVVAKQVRLQVQCPTGIRPLTIIGRDGRIQGQTAEIYLNQLYGDQEKYVLLEVQIDDAQAEETREIAQAEVTYHDVFAKKDRSMKNKVKARFTADQHRVLASTNSVVQQASLLNYYAIAQDNAVALADQGQIDEALLQLEQATVNLKQVGEANKDDVLLEKAKSMEELASDIQQKGMTKKNRKLLRTDSYQMRNQQQIETDKPE